MFDFYRRGLWASVSDVTFSGVLLYNPKRWGHVVCTTAPTRWMEKIYSVGPLLSDLNTAGVVYRVQLQRLHSFRPKQVLLSACSLYEAQLDPSLEQRSKILFSLLPLPSCLIVEASVWIKPAILSNFLFEWHTHALLFSISDVLGGYNGTIFAYGQTSSGKTHTMEVQYR